MLTLKQLPTWQKYIAIGAIAIVAFWLLVVLQVQSILIPNYVTEEVTIVSKTSTTCVVETADEFLVTIKNCEGEIGQKITATYDANVKERALLFAP